MQSLNKLPSRSEMIEAILRGEFSNLVFLDDLGRFAATFGNRPAPETNKALQAKRASFEAMSDCALELRYEAHLRWLTQAKVSEEAQNNAKARADASAKEAAQFYNRPEAQANLMHWSKAEYWTFDEAIALLLGKSPKVVTPERVRQEITAIETGFFLGKRPAVPAFLRQYEDLYDLARRAEATKKPHLHPVTAVVWARTAGATMPPDALIQLLRARAKAELQARIVSAIPPVALLSAPIVLLAKEPAEPARTAREWTIEALADLQAFRERHTAKETGDNFHISTGRVRQLLIRYRERSKLPTAHSPFGR